MATLRISTASAPMPESWESTVTSWEGKPFEVEVMLALYRAGWTSLVCRITRIVSLRSSSRAASSSTNWAVCWARSRVLSSVIRSSS